MSNEKAFYDKLTLKLKESTNFPTVYLYKFIVPTTDEHISSVKAVFKATVSKIELKESKNKKYTSISIKMNASTVEEIILKYKEVGKIKGVISL